MISVDTEAIHEAFRRIWRAAVRRPKDDFDRIRCCIPVRRDDDDIVIGDAIRELAKLRAVGEAAERYLVHKDEGMTPALEDAVRAWRGLNSIIDPDSETSGPDRHDAPRTPRATKNTEG
jgi:hypothetical protein